MEQVDRRGRRDCQIAGAGRGEEAAGIAAAFARLRGGHGLPRITARRRGDGRSQVPPKRAEKLDPFKNDIASNFGRGADVIPGSGCAERCGLLGLPQMGI